MKDTITLGILGGGQLGRMSAMAAARLGIATVIFCPEEDSPASHVAIGTMVAAYNDEEALKAFADKCNFITYEFENIPVETIEYLESLKAAPIYPEKALLLVSQDRIKEKSFINDLAIKTTRWKEISNIDDIKAAVNDWNASSFILKTTRFGYDGKGQIKCNALDLDSNSELSAFLEKVNGQGLIMEEPVDFTCEVSVIIARDVHGNSQTYGPMLNEHKNHILHKTTVPCGIDQGLNDRAIEIAKTIADEVNLIGVLTVEFFVCKDGSVLVNEIAPRTHNSGHWSIDACAVSQFENHVRTVCGLPVGSSTRHSDAVMLNLIGDDINNIDQYLTDPYTCVHLYGKKEARNARKMGHITFLETKGTSK